MNHDLIKPISDAEIKRAVKALKRDSAPGAYGMIGNFFQRFWSITGAQVTAEIKEFFVTGSFPEEWNFTELCLLPKKPNPN